MCKGDFDVLAWERFFGSRQKKKKKKKKKKNSSSCDFLEYLEREKPKSV